MKNKNNTPTLVQSYRNIKNAKKLGNKEHDRLKNLARALYKRKDF